MIGRLRGIIESKQAPNLLIDVGGVGYELQASMHTFDQLPHQGTEIVLYTHFVVREDAQQLYGFISLQERQLFRALIKVNGVGPKLALTILSSIHPDQFVQCIISNDSVSLVQLPGIGKKTAERLIIEMRDRLDDWYSNNQEFGVVNELAQIPSNSAMQDALNALISLGYKPHEASKVIAQFAQTELSSEALIRAALKSMVNT